MLPFGMFRRSAFTAAVTAGFAYQFATFRQMGFVVGVAVLGTEMAGARASRPCVST